MLRMRLLAFLPAVFLLAAVPAGAESIKDILNRQSGKGPPAAQKVEEETKVAPSAVRAQDDLTRECDRLTAASFDQDLPAGTKRVFFEDMDGPRAVKACAAAAEAHPDNRRIVFQYGRALDKVQRYGEAMEHYQRAAAMGSAAAMNNIGADYNDGRGVARNYKEAMRWFERSAALGYPRALVNLGLAYEDGEGVAVDPERAVEYYIQSVEKGSDDLFQNVRTQTFTRPVMRLLQRHLIELGYLSGSADGSLGPATRRAFEAWEEAEGF